MLSKIVVVVNQKIPSISGTIENNETKIYEDAYASNNERGELIIQDGKHDTIAVFKEWLYWEKLE